MLFAIETKKNCLCEKSNDKFLKKLKKLGNGFWFYLKRNRNKMETKSYELACKECIKNVHTKLMKTNKIQSKE